MIIDIHPNYKKLLELVDSSPEIERFIFQNRVKTIDEAIEVSGFKKSQFIKTIVLRHKDTDEFVISILKAGSNVDRKVLREGVKPKRWKLATITEVLELTGFPVGGVPAICLGSLTKYVDPRVLKEEFVVSGGGDEMSLIKLPSRLIIEDGAIEKIVSFG